MRQVARQAGPLLHVDERTEIAQNQAEAATGPLLAGSTPQMPFPVPGVPPTFPMANGAPPAFPTASSTPQMPFPVPGVPPTFPMANSAPPAFPTAGGAPQMPFPVPGVSPAFPTAGSAPQMPFAVPGVSPTSPMANSAPLTFPTAGSAPQMSLNVPQTSSNVPQTPFPASDAAQTSPVASGAPATTPARSDAASRPLVIRAETRRRKQGATAEKPGRHLSLRLRQGIVLSIILMTSLVTLATLVPLASGQSPWNLPPALSFLIQSARTNWQGLASQQSSQPSQPKTTTSMPTMNIPQSQLVSLAEQDASNAGISPTYFVRQINLESGFNPNAVSPSGAEGIAQFEPSTAAGLGIDPFNPTQALQAAAQMMARYSNAYGGYAKALAAYNAGPAALQNAENACGANWLSCMTAQTQNYVAVIMGT